MGNRLFGNMSGCFPEAGSFAVLEREQHNTARIPDAMIRRQDLPRAVFDIISLAERMDWRTRDRKRQDLQAVAGVTEIIEIYREQLAIHIHRKGAHGTSIFSPTGGTDAALDLFSTGERMSVPLLETDAFEMPADEVDQP